MMILALIVGLCVVAGFFSTGSKAQRQIKLENEVERLRAKGPPNRIFDLVLYIALTFAFISFIIWCGPQG